MYHGKTISRTQNVAEKHHNLFNPSQPEKTMKVFFFLDAPQFRNDITFVKVHRLRLFVLKSSFDAYGEHWRNDNDGGNQRTRRKTAISVPLCFQKNSIPTLPSGK
jgi:hypothetical protein